MVHDSDIKKELKGVLWSIFSLANSDLVNRSEVIEHLANYGRDLLERLKE